jgi:hypothetical protein
VNHASKYNKPGLLFVSGGYSFIKLNIDNPRRPGKIFTMPIVWKVNCILINSSYVNGYGNSSRKPKSILVAVQGCL